MMERKKAFNMEYSEKIFEIIKAKNLTIYKISKETGISESVFSTWKKKPTSKMTAEHLLKIAEYLDVSTDYLLGRNTNKKKPINERVIEIRKRTKEMQFESTEELIRIAEEENISLDYLLGRTNNPEINEDIFDHGKNVG